MGMCVQRLKRSILGAGFIILLSAACNQMDTVLSAAGTYQVDALNNQVSLNECSVIAAGETIRPYFVNPVVDDPDLLGLILYIEDAEGEILGRRMFYTADAGLTRKGPPEGDQDPVPDEVLEEKTEEQDEKPVNTAAVFLEEDITIPVKNFTGKLPPFPLPENLEIGAYSLVFEIRGEYTMLSRTIQPFYYVGDQKFTAGEIRHYLPGSYGNSHLVPPGLTVMLESQVDCGEDLDPYIVWYNGKNKIGEGFVAAGAARLLWKAPLRSGFHTIRAELFPFKPGSGQKGKTKVFSLPVSQKNETIPGAEADDYLYWYRFTGDLLDAKTGKSLNPAQGSGLSPSWYPAEQVYGLALAEGDSYEVPGHSLVFSENGGERIGFFIRVLPLKDGGIFSARLGSSLGVRLFLKGGILFLDLEEEGQTAQISKELPEPRRGPVFAGIFITVKLEERRVRASLALGDSSFGGLDGTGSPWPGMESGDKDAVPIEDLPIQKEDAPSEWVEIDLALPLGGELRAWIGEEPEKLPKPERAKEIREESPSPYSLVSLEEPAAKSPLPPVLVIDDFAAMFQVFQSTVLENAGDDPLSGAQDDTEETGEETDIDTEEDSGETGDEADETDESDEADQPEIDGKSAAPLSSITG
jgi:hypothetical protein